ncbi:MAG: non-ribosomal peptide synthetase, partial [Burkholderiales bacterium]
MNDFSQRIANLSAEKRALLEAHLKNQRRIAKRSIPRLPRSEQTQSFPVSFAEQRLWFLDQWEPNSPLYNIGIAYTFDGPVNVGLLERCAEEIVSRHESLRTSFSTQDGEPVRLIHPSVDLSLALTDLRALPEDQREAEARRLAFEEAQAAFDLTKAPLLRVKLLRLDAEKHVLLIVIHHIVSDGWSIGVFLKELSQRYSAYLHGTQPSLPELPVQYANYAVWQRQWLMGKELDKQRTYWKEQLAGSPALLELPTDRPRPALQSFNGARQTRMMPKRLGDGLKTLSQREGATLFMALLAAFQILLSRYSRSSDVAVGSPIAGRTRAETENLIGFFVNTLVLRTDLSGNRNFRELLGRVREVALGAYSHQDLPFEKLVEELKPERSLSHSPLFQVMFVLQSAGSRELHLPGITVSEFEFERVNAKFDLSLAATETGQGLKLDVDYNTDLFDAETITRLLDHYESLLEGIIADPNRCIADLPLISEQERKLILTAWNDTETDYPKHATIASLFEAQVRHMPAATALIFEDQALSYSQLNAKANRLAHHLQALGVGPETLVAVCAQRSIELVAALLAILKAGGAYLPLDPNYPEERLAFMLEDGAVEVVLTQRSIAVPYQRAKLVYIDALERDCAGYPDTDPESNVEANNLAYVIYTSGSTGRPKGVAIEQRSAVALLSWAADTFAPEQWAGTLASTSICFDLSVFELFVPLSVGGAVILVKNALELPTLKCADQVTLVNTVPSAAVELLRIDGLPASVRTVNLAGEPLSTELVRQLYDQGIDRVYDLYGPTEDTTYSTFALRSRHGGATIGRPIANTQVYILDAYLNPVPVGVRGEIHIGGAGLARGYLNRPELTAEKFIANPFSEDPDARLYKTG